MLAFGLPGLVYVVMVVVTHMLVDRWKVQATRRAERRALEAAALAGIERTGEVPTSGLGGAWTPWPGMLFLADQALHLTIAIVGWLVILYGVPLPPWFVDLVDMILRTGTATTVHAVILTGVVLVSLFLVNTRGAYYFVLALVSPRDLPDRPRPTRSRPHAAPHPAPPGTPCASGRSSRPSSRASRSGGRGAGVRRPAPDARAEACRPCPAGRRRGSARRSGRWSGCSSWRFVLVGARPRSAFVIAVKTLARFKQLDDRGFAEYYLLGTLASVAVAFIGAAYLAMAAFWSLSLAGRSDEGPRDPLPPLALEERLAVEADVEGDPDVEGALVARDRAAWRGCPPQPSPGPAIDDVARERACAGSASEAVSTSRSDEYRREPSSWVLPPPSKIVTATVPRSTSSSIRHSGGVLLVRADLAHARPAPSRNAGDRSVCDVVGQDGQHEPRRRRRARRGRAARRGSATATARASSS